MMRKSNQEYRYDFDALRGVMMLLGIVLHAGVSFMVNPVEEIWPYKYKETHIVFDLIVAIIHLFRIPVFYVVAGYFMAFQMQKYEWSHVLRKKVNRIGIPFLFGLIIWSPIVTFCFYLLISHTDNVTFASIQSYSKMITWNTIHFWFLYYLMGFYLVHLLVRKVVERLVLPMKLHIKKIMIILAFAQLLVLIFFGVTSMHGSYQLLPPMGSLVYFFLFYILGVLVYSRYEEFRAIVWLNYKKGILTIILLGLYIAILDHRPTIYTLPYGKLLESVVSIITTYSLVIVVFGFFQHIFKKENVILRFIASASYFIYIVHLPILIWILFFVQQSVKDPYLLYMILVIGTAILSFLTYSLKRVLEPIIFPVTKED